MNTLQQLIKELSAEQTNLKSQRKTGTYDSSVAYYKQPENIRAAWSAANQVRDNKPRITAALNLLHELKGSDYCHAIPYDDYDYRRLYKIAMRELKEEFVAEAAE